MIINLTITELKAPPIEWMRLSFVSGIGLSSYWRLVEYFEHPSAVFQSSKKELKKIRGITERQVDSILAQDYEKRCEVELARLEKVGGSVICYGDPLYPQTLKQLVDPPPVLYAIGDISLLHNPCVAIVGSRSATGYGKRIAYSLAYDLSRYTINLVSGLALGIDAESHRGMLAGKGATIAVLGCGLDVVYPRQNIDLYRAIAKDGLILSEYPLGTRPDGFRFPARNRIISGLSRGVVVVEAARKSGSLITAQMALDYGREVFAVPGQVDSFKSEGTHWLLRQGAKLVQKGDDIIEELCLEKYCSVTGGILDKLYGAPEIDPEALALLELIECYPQLREVIMGKSRLSSARVCELLLFLELEGLIELLPGDKLCKIKKVSDPEVSIDN